MITDDGRLVEAGSGEVGRVGIAGRVPLGYHKDPEKTATTFPTVDGIRYSVPGDFATVEADGSITLLGRGSVCINTGGEKVFPEEVEESLKGCCRGAGCDRGRCARRCASASGWPRSWPVSRRRCRRRMRSPTSRTSSPTTKPPGTSSPFLRLERAANGKVDYSRWTAFAERAVSNEPNET